MARIGIVGAGVVGKATGQGFAKWGHEVAFCDIKQSAIREFSDAGFVAADPITFRDVATDITMVSVSTPTVNHQIELRYLISAISEVGIRLCKLSRGHVVIIRSTIPPATTESLLVPRLAKYSGLRPGIDFHIGYNPGFLRQASAEADFLEPWLTVLGASDPVALCAMRSLYEDNVPRGTIVEVNIPTAEMIKYASNLYNATKISFSNEIWQVCRALGISSDNVMAAVSRSAEGMWNPSYGTRGGTPYGGACLPKDTKGFYSYARSLGLSMDLLHSVIAVNEKMQALVRHSDPEFETYPEPALIMEASSHNGAGNGSMAPIER